MENNHQQQQFSNKICNKLTCHWTLEKRQKLVKCAISLSLGYGHGTFPDLKPILLCFLQCLLADKNAIQHVKPTQRFLMVLFFDIWYNLINSGKKQLILFISNQMVHQKSSKHRYIHRTVQNSTSIRGVKMQSSYEPPYFCPLNYPPTEFMHLQCLQDRMAKSLVLPDLNCTKI